MNAEKTKPNYFMLGEWIEIANKILKDKGTVLILGAVDTGKSVLTLMLTNYLIKRGRRVGIVDIDMGQSVIGPPATVGMAVVNQVFDDLNELKPDSLYFIGSTSPIYRMLPTIVGAKKLVEEGKKKDAEIIIMDTPGLVNGMMGKTFNENMIEVIYPRHIVALQREEELEPILFGFTQYEGINIYHLSPCPEVRKKSYFQRREIRERKFRAYFKNSRSLTLSLAGLIIRGSYYGLGIPLKEEEIGFIEKHLTTEIVYAEKNWEGIFIITKKKTFEEINGWWEIKKQFKAKKIIFTEEEMYKNLLVSLGDKNGLIVSLGIIKELNFKDKILTLFTPLPEEKLSLTISLTLGLLKINKEGKELGKIYSRGI
ncbi:MAG: Clp1/GlmU family protein [Candidatus Caldatribacteriota bacterium]